MSIFLTVKSLGSSGYKSSPGKPFSECAEEMDDLSVKATKLVIEYRLEIVEEIQEKVRGKFKEA